MTSRQCSFSSLLNPDWSIQISGVPAICKVVRYIFNGRVYTQNFTIIAKGDYMLDIQARVVRKVDNAIQRINHYPIAQNAYCSWDIYFQFKSVVDLSYSRLIMHRRLERASIIGCQERTTTLINLMKATN